MYFSSVLQYLVIVNKKINILYNYLLFSTCQVLYSYCHIPYNGNKKGDFYEYEYYIEILTVFA